jgi:urea transport system permease protein
MNTFLSIALQASYLVSVLALVALGLGVIYGLLGVINMAHGEFVAIGAYCAVLVTASGLSYWLALPLALLVGMLVGILLQLIFIRRLTERPLDAILVTLGLSLVLQQVLQLIFGAGPRSVANPVPTSFTFLGVAYPSIRLIVIALAVVVILGVFLFFSRSTFGLVVRAILQNREAALTHGVNARKYNMLAFGMGTALAALAGALVAPSANVLPQMGGIYLAPAFIAVILGGSSRLIGVVAGALFMGGLEVLGGAFIPQTLARAGVLVLAILVIRLRPGGLVREAKERVA